MPRPWIAFKRLAVALLLVGAAWLGGVQAAQAPSIPAPTGLVNDFANALTPEEKETINGIATGLQEATGAQMAFVIMDSTDPYDDFTYGMAVFNQWQIGQKGKDNGLLILLALKEHRIRIITGYGLEAILPDGKVGRFRDEYLVPYLKQNKVGEGLANLGLRFAQEVAQAEGKTLNGAAAQAPHRQSHRGGSPLANLIILLVFVAISIVSSLLNRRRGGRGGFFYGGGVNYTGGGGGFGGGFSGFGGGMSGGGGAGGSW